MKLRFPPALPGFGNVPGRLLATGKLKRWDRICGKHLLPEWMEKANGMIHDYGIQLFYFDTQTPISFITEPSGLSSKLSRGRSREAKE